jgi:hypothetical protein
MAAGNDTEVAALYRLPVAEFVAARDQLAKRLRSAGDREAARRVAALRRPSVSVWAANQLPAAAPRALAELLAAGEALREAQDQALAGEPGAARMLRRATAQQRAVVAQLVQRAETLLARAGHAASDQTLARVAATLHAAATGDADTRAALAEGRLQADLDPAGFGFGGPFDQAEPAEDGPPAAAAEPAAAPGAAPSGGARQAAARQAAMRTVERTGRAAERAAAALADAEAALARQEEAAATARQRAERLAGRARELADEAARAAAAASDAEERAEQADREVEAVGERARAAGEAAEEAAEAHAAARAVLDELSDEPD